MSGADQAAPDAGLRLLTVAHEGAGTVPFRPWRPLLEPDIRVEAVLLPGGERRIREQPVASLGVAVETIVAEAPPGLVEPFAILGHSVAAPIAFELRAGSRHGA